MSPADAPSASRIYIDQHLLHSIMLPYGVTMFDYEILKQTSVEAVVVVTTRSYPADKYLVRLYRLDQLAPGDLDRTLSYLRYLYQQSLPIPEVHENQEGSPVTSFKSNHVEWGAVVLTYSTGAPPTAYMPLVLERMALLQADMHNSGYRFGLAQTKHIREMSSVQGFTLSGTPHSFSEDPRFKALIARAQAYSVEFETATPRGYAHATYDGDSVIFDKNIAIQGITLFANLWYMPLVYALGHTLWHVLFMSSDIHLVQHYLFHYQSRRLLSDLESAYVVPAMLACHYQSLQATLSHMALDPTGLSRYIGIEQYLRQQQFVPASAI